MAISLKIAKVGLPPASFATALADWESLPWFSIFWGIGGFTLTRIAVMRRSDGTKGLWYEDLSLFLVLMMGLVLAITGHLPPFSSAPMAIGPAFLTGVGLGWGGMRALQIMGKAGLAAWEAMSKGGPVDKN